MIAAQELPERRNVVATYDRGVDAYDELWSPVILPPAEKIVRALALPRRARVLDVGAGTGALLPAIRAAVPDATVVALDASNEMLRAARIRRGAAAVRADALGLPVAGESVDGVLLAYVLFHLPLPVQGIAEAARVLCRGGRLGTVTWARSRESRADAAWTEAFRDANVPVLPLRQVNTHLDSCDGVAGLLAAAGLRVECSWLESLRHRWDPPSFWQHAIGSGGNRTRLGLLEEGAQREVLADAHRRLAALTPDDYEWEGEVVCAVATKV
jgi:SAM-dependent methyltransferase